MVEEIQYVRFKCPDGHVTTVKYGTTNVDLSHCAVCGTTDVDQIEPQCVDADIIASPSQLEFDP